MTKYAVTERGILGVFTYSPFGWRFLPWVQHSPSRKHWPTPSLALPKWAREAIIIEANNAQQASERWKIAKGIISEDLGGSNDHKA